MLFLILFISYLIGSIPFGFLLTKIFLKIDIRNIGSGNIGATNALRTGNKLIGYSTLVLDISKAVILLLIIKFNFSEYLLASSIAVFLGHVFPIYVGFRGGKGVATLLGFMLAVFPEAALISIVVFVLTLLFSKYVSLSSIFAGLIFPFGVPKRRFYLRPRKQNLN